MAPKLRHRARAGAYQTRARLRTTIRTRRAERQRRKAHTAWARQQMKAELATRAQRRADYRVEARETKEIIRTRRPGYKRAYWGRAASEEEKEVARECLRIIKDECREERRIARVELKNAMLDKLYKATYPYSERVLYSRAVAWMGRVQRRRRALGFRWFEFLPWLREERRRDRVEYGVMRARRERERRAGRWDRMREGVLREVEKYEKLERKERAREVRKDWRRIRAGLRARKRLRAKKRAKARVRRGLKTVKTSASKIKSLPKRTRFSVLKKKVAASVAWITALSKKTPLADLKKKKVAFADDDNDALPRPPVVSGAPSDQETASLGEEAAPVGSVGARKWKLGSWRNVFGGKKIKGADESA